MWATFTCRCLAGQRVASGDTVTLHLLASESISTPAVEIAGQVAAVTGPAPNTQFDASIILNATDREGAIPFTVRFTAPSGVHGMPVRELTSGADLEFRDDRLPPTLSWRYAVPERAASVCLELVPSEDIMLPNITVQGNQAFARVEGVAPSSSFKLLVYNSRLNDTRSISIMVDYADRAGNQGERMQILVDSDRLQGRLAALPLAVHPHTSAPPYPPPSLLPIPLPLCCS